MQKGNATVKDVGYTMFQVLGVAEIPKGVMNGKSPNKRERSPKPERKAHIQHPPRRCPKGRLSYALDTLRSRHQAQLQSRLAYVNLYVFFK